MHLNLVDVDAFCAELAEVESTKVYEGGKFNKTGLFSQQIFGPVKSYYCSCSKAGYRGRNSTEKTCQACKVDITTSDVRRRRYAKVTLPFKVLNPGFFYIVAIHKPALRRAMYNMLTYKQAYRIEEDELKRIGPEDTSETGKLEGLKGVLSLVDWLVEKNQDKPEYQFFKDNDQCFQFVISNQFVSLARAGSVPRRLLLNLPVARRSQTHSELPRSYSETPCSS